MLWNGVTVTGAIRKSFINHRMGGFNHSSWLRLLQVSTDLELARLFPSFNHKLGTLNVIHGTCIGNSSKCQENGKCDSRVNKKMLQYRTCSGRYKSYQRLWAAFVAFVLARHTHQWSHLCIVPLRENQTNIGTISNVRPLPRCLF